MKKAATLVVEEGGLTSHAAVVGVSIVFWLLLV
ncbi:PEP-utilizing enzyme [Bacillus cereus]